MFKKCKESTFFRVRRVCHRQFRGKVFFSSYIFFLAPKMWSAFPQELFLLHATQRIIPMYNRTCTSHMHLRLTRRIYSDNVHCTNWNDTLNWRFCVHWPQKEGVKGREIWICVTIAKRWAVPVKCSFGVSSYFIERSDVPAPHEILHHLSVGQFTYLLKIWIWRPSCAVGHLTNNPLISLTWHELARQCSQICCTT